MKKISEFLSENFQFLVVNFSIYLNRRVFRNEPVDDWSCSNFRISDVRRKSVLIFRVNMTFVLARVCLDACISASMLDKYLNIQK